LSSPATTSKFESALLEQLDAAHNLARWLTRSDHDAQDVVQDSCMKALRALDSFRGGDFRAWFLTIVRNTSFNRLRQNKTPGDPSNQQSLEAGPDIAADCQVYDPGEIALRAANADLVRRAIAALPDVSRETIVLREMEGLSYKEISKIADVPIGTVMSRLARARMQLQALLIEMDPSTPAKPAHEAKQ
jgi:RNA polymerase sigma factor (sigma-70 family)